MLFIHMALYYMRMYVAAVRAVRSSVLKTSLEVCVCVHARMYVRTYMCIVLHS